MDNYDVTTFIFMMAAYFVMSFATSVIYIDKEPSRNRDRERDQILERLYMENHTNCHDMLRMNRISFHRLCEHLEGKGLMSRKKRTSGDDYTSWVTIKEQVAMFLLILGHGNRTRQGSFEVIRPTEKIHRHFHIVLRAVLRLGREYIKQPTATYSLERSGNPKPWAIRYFQDCDGAIDGTFMPALVPEEDQPRYRNRKGDIAHYVLMACSFDMKITYVLAGWEGSAPDTRLLTSTVTHRKDKLIVPKDKYYLGDAGFPLVPGFLVPYRGTRCHLKEQEGNSPQMAKELFNLRHSSLCNVIERTFRLLKKHFAYLRHTPFYSVDTQIDLILACCIIHNFIRCEDPNDIGSVWKDLEEDEEETHDIATLSSCDSWTTFRDSLAATMWTDLHHN